MFDRILHFTIYPVIAAHPSISVLPFIRLATTVVLASAATLFAINLRQLGLPILFASFISALTFILPGAQQYVEHADEFAIAVGILFGLGGGMLLTASGARMLSVRRLLAGWPILLTSLLLLLLACNTYQGSGMFYLIPIISALLFAGVNGLDRFKLAFAQLGFFCGGLILYFLTNRFALIPLGARLIPAVNDPAIGYYHFDLTSTLFQKLVSLITELIPVAARLWWFQFKYAGYIVILTIILGISTLTLRPAPSERLGGRRVRLNAEPLLILIFVVAAGMLANAPTVMSNAVGPFFRLLFPCSALFVLLLAWIGWNLLRGPIDRFRVILIAIAAIVGFSAYSTVQDSAANANIEVTILRAAIGQLTQNKDPIKELFIVRPPDSPPYLGANPVSPDEFNAPSSKDRAFTYGMVRVLSQAAGTSWSELNRPRVEPVFDPAYFVDPSVIDSLDPAVHNASCKSNLIYLHEGAVIADMAAPLYLAPTFMKTNPGSCAREFAYYDVSPEVFAKHSSLRLFDFDRTSDSYWQTEPYPVVFRVRYAGPKVITNYTLGAGNDVTKMPVSWRFEGSVDSVSWVLLDEPQNQATWLPGQQREYPIANHNPYRYYRFVFTKGVDTTLRIAKIAFHGEPTQPTVSYEPVLLTSYEGYNVILVGDLYVGLAQELGSIDALAILRNALPRPPDVQFIVAKDIASLKRMIDNTVDPYAPPRVLYTYRFYNVVRFRQLYVGIARELGAIDVGAVLTDTAPRPPADKFIVAHDIQSLKAAIDAAHPLVSYLRWRLNSMFRWPRWLHVRSQAR